MYDRILVPLDGSVESEEALPHAREIARRFGGRLVLLHVIEPLALAPVPSFAGPEISVGEPAGEDADRRYLDTHVQALADEGIPAVSLLLHGGGSEGILSAIRDQTISLVVMAPHDRGSLMRLLGSSTVRSVLARVTVPVLVVQPTHPAR